MAEELHRAMMAEAPAAREAQAQVSGGGGDIGSLENFDGRQILLIL